MWAVINVIEGRIVYRILEPSGEAVLTPDKNGPEQPHELQLMGLVRLVLRALDKDPTQWGGPGLNPGGSFRSQAQARGLFAGYSRYALSGCSILFPPSYPGNNSSAGSRLSRLACLLIFRRMYATKILWVQIFLVSIVVLAFVWAATEWTA